MFLSVSYATQEALRTHHPIKIQKAEGLRAYRGNSGIGCHNVHTKPHDGRRASSVHDDIPRCHSSRGAGTRKGPQSTNSGHS